VLLISLTVLACGLGYEIIRRQPLLNWLAGGTPARSQAAVLSAPARPVTG